MVSFIIPSYNSYKTIEDTIKSIFQQTRLDMIKDVIVVDSSDDQKTRAVLAQFQFPQLTVIQLNVKTSPALGRNLGAKNAKGDLFCFIDSDVYLSKDWLKQILEAYESGHRAGCGAISLPPFQTPSMLATAQLYLQFNEYLNSGILHDRSFVPSCNLFCGREAFEKVGGFPDLRASEDTMFCLSLNKIEKIWFVPQAECFHIFREEWSSFERNQDLLGRYVIIYRRQYYKKWFYRGLFAVVLFPAFLTIKLIWIILRIRKAGKVHQRAFMKSLGVFLMGVVYWSRGFIKGCFDNDAVTRR